MVEAILKKEIVTDKQLCRALGVAGFVILTALGAFVRIPLPFTPVPVTLQTFFVLLSGAFLGGSLGAVTQLTYIFLGLLGLPVFAGAASGLFYVFGPTAGYLFGFIFAALFLGRFIKYSGQSFLLTFGFFCIADFILLGCGVIWLKVFFGYHLEKLLFIGFFPFFVVDSFKALFATVIYLRLQSRLKTIF